MQTRGVRFAQGASRARGPLGVRVTRSPPARGARIETLVVLVVFDGILLVAPRAGGED